MQNNFIQVNKIFIRADRLRAMERIIGHPLNTEDGLALCIGVEEVINAMVDEFIEKERKNNELNAGNFAQ